MASRWLRALAKPRRNAVNHWFQPLNALGLEARLAIAALVSIDLVFLASPHVLADHLLMVGFWVVVGVLSTTALCHHYRHRWLLDLMRLLPLLVLILGWAMLSALWSREPAFTAGRAAALYFEVVLGIFIGFCFAPREVMAILAWTLGLLLILNTAWAVLLPEQGAKFDYRADAVSWRGIAVGRNHLGALAAAAAVFFLVALLRRRLPWLLALGGTLLGTLVVYMTRSATALILLAIFMPATVVLVIAGRLRQSYLGAVLLLLLAGPGAWYAADHLDEATALVEREPSFTHRTEIWREARDLIRHRPFTGWGFQMVWGHRQASWFPDLPFTVEAWHAHNGYVQLAAELGVPAAALALLMVLTLIVRSFAAHAATGSAFALFCCVYFTMFAVGNLSESKLFFLVWPEWTIFVALAVAFARAAEAVPALPRGERRFSAPERRHVPGARLTRARARRHAKGAIGGIACHAPDPQIERLEGRSIHDGRGSG